MMLLVILFVLVAVAIVAALPRVVTVIEAELLVRRFRRAGMAQVRLSRHQENHRVLRNKLDELYLDVRNHRSPSVRELTHEVLTLTIFLSSAHSSKMISYPEALGLLDKLYKSMEEIQRKKEKLFAAEIDDMLAAEIDDMRREQEDYMSWK